MVKRLLGQATEALLCQTKLLGVSCQNWGTMGKGSL